MKRKLLFLVIVASLATGLAEHLIYAQDRSDHLLTKGVTESKVTLQQGLTAAAQQGRPISAKFEVEDGKLQLSVYTAKDGKFSEVIVDHTTGNIAKTESITEGEDLAEAKAQNTAMGKKAKTDLKAAVDKAAGATSGSRAISVIPAVKDGHVIASVTLLTGQQLKTVDQPLE
jgi:tryptophan synthase beta subunit